MKELLSQFAAYNLWAHQRIIDAINELPDYVQNQKIESSFSSLKLTLEHLKNTEFIWWQRMKLIETPLPSSDPEKTISDITNELIALSKQWKEWIDKSTVAAFEHEFVYRNSKKEQFKQPVFQMLLHLFNHQTYHRGQLVTMLRQCGVTQIPATDFILWSRSKK